MRLRVDLFGKGRVETEGSVAPVDFDMIYIECPQQQGMMEDGTN